MSNFNNNALTTMLNALRSELTQVSLHSSDPGTTGAGELTGGSYARQAVTFSSVSNGVMTVNNAPTFDVPPSGAVRWAGFWAGGAFRVKVPVTEEVYSVNGGTYQLLNTTSLSVANA